MFAIHTPQTVTLHDEDGEEATAIVNFSTNGADTSRCKMEIMSKGRKWTAVFNTRGGLIDQSYTGPDEGNDPKTPELNAGAYMVNGRDTRADNPFTYQPPVDADTRYRDGVAPGHTAPIPTGEDGKPVVDHNELREKAMKDAESNAKKARDDRKKEADEKPEDREKRLAKERDERLDKATESDTKAVDGKTNEKGEDFVTSQTFPTPGTERRDPLVPAPSTALPGGEPAHPQSAQQYTERSKVNTSQSMNQPGYNPAQP